MDENRESRNPEGTGGLAQAKARALRILEVMDRTERQLEEKLEKDGYAGEVIAEVMKYVKRYGYVDDEAYAESFVRRSAGKKSRRNIYFDLLKRGIPKELAEASLEEFLPEGAEAEAAAAAAAKKASRLDLKDPKDRAKLASYLTRQGYGYSVVSEVVEELSEGSL